MCRQLEHLFKANVNVEKRFTLLVEEINKKYERLRFLTNDELRNEGSGLRASMERCDDAQNALNKKLPEAYALVKEVARRFSEGDIEVSANDNDRKKAENVDFILIKGDKAIYRNKWTVNELPFQWNMIHYDEQLLGGILLHYGYAIEMATGEGKTLVATLPVFLNALTHAGVHLMTANNYLSKRDYEITRPIYIFLGLTVDCIEFFDRLDVRRKNAYKADITFGTTSSFAFDYLWDHLATDPNECVQREHNYAIIDELDSTLIDDADNPHIVGGGQYYDNSQIYKDNIAYVKELIALEGSTNFYTKDILRRSASFTKAGIEWLKEKIGDINLFKFTKLYQIRDFASLSEDDKEAIYSRLNLQNALQQLLLALVVYEKNVDYVVIEADPPMNPDATIVIIDQNTGRLRKSSRWEHGLHTAIEVKEGVKPQKDFDGMGVISLKNFLRLYSKVAGMSGTILAASDELNELYGIKCALLPTHKPNVRIDFPLRIFKTSKDKDTAILETVKNAHQSGRPVLLGCLTIKRAEYLATLLCENGVSCNLLDAKNEKDEPTLISNAGIGNTITVATSIAGRGVDIKPSSDALTNGGLLVVGSDLFNSVRVNQQLKGRTGRQGNPGSSIFFASLEDMVLRYLADEDKKKLSSLIEKENNSEIISQEVMTLFSLAQNNREQFNREKRLETARKDDIIAIRRKKFYENRNAVLHNQIYAEKIFDRIIDLGNMSKDVICQKLHTIYSLFSILLERNLKINPDMEKLPVPFLCQGQPFVLEFYIRNFKYDFDTFVAEFKRRLILLTYDRCWKDFVLYILGDLDTKEVDGLDEKFNNMMVEINHSLAKLISESKIIFNPKIEDDTPDKTDKIEKPKPVLTVNPDSPCPCGSGKKYCECHGRNIRNKSKRRR